MEQHHGKKETLDRGDGRMKSIEEISHQLVRLLTERGYVIDNVNGGINAIILALSEAHQLGVELGKRSGKINILESMEEEIHALRNDILIEIQS